MTGADEPGEAPVAPRGGRRRVRRWASITLMVAGLVVAGAVAVAAGSGRSDSSDRPRLPGGSTPHPTVPADLDGRALLGAPLRTRTGQPTTLAAAGDRRPMLVNFWAEWCAPCIAEMPLLERARAANPGVRFVGINEMDKPPRAEAMAKRTGITYEWFLDTDGSFAAKAETVNLPTTLYLRPDGTVAATRVGAFKSAGQLQRWLAGAARSRP